ncbi:MAG: cytochrome c nitrite reductase small subunit [Bacteroidetes bacterium GWF2_42_66]|nr:MAG: cytochrome c nitrite reductase small subunit [Bacteroidetes bacterium GWA2_42_15]OFX96945.1 MAG: cytochrome c nitrite reductase small subunit [Bacteroidetes bacterium GWE2_42_39]OFY44702.1 MAG: cytochrome c nitrite reductase small subunit [Bacteroidetes bacterium GWF2_42_66]HBL75006.1 cytochrome c nitrite reductase small subunit [Prolixibacteraceae bacterium]HCU60321.1 cytochrome c nitrite reductase small subunit [Prolixibacteraceae bacterium]
MLIKLIKQITPPKEWRFPVLILCGIFAGFGIYSFYISKAHSYLSDQPETCVNCHIMAPQYATWNHSSHREHANCNDCHVPHNNVLNKYFFKAKDGMRHASMFTLRMEPQVIFIHEAGRNVVHNNCIRCHSNLLLDPKLVLTVKNQEVHATNRVCWECHREVPHGRVNSLSSVPNARVPLPESPVPAWLENVLKTEKPKN